MHKPIPLYPSIKAMNCELVTCRLCPRLVEFRESVPVRKSFEGETYWRKPVPGFGDSNAWLLITGLAPSAQGGNRTGRLFTGDKSSEFLIKALYKAGFANQPTSLYEDDGLQLLGCYMTAVVKCVPPKDKPLLQEVYNCSRYYRNELLLLKKTTHILVLGKVAFDTYRKSMLASGKKVTPIKFEHGARYTCEGGPTIYASYHPSPQNTNTGKLTVEMFQDLLLRIKDDQNGSIVLETAIEGDNLI